MKLTTTAFALALAASASPVLAQYHRPPPPPPPQIPNNVPAQNGGQQSEAPAPKDGNPHPSAKAFKAIVDYQKAVNANDTANMPAKLAAAQAVASTKDDRYIISQLQLKGALTANDEAGMAAAIDGIANSGFVDKPGTIADL